MIEPTIRVLVGSYYFSCYQQGMVEDRQVLLHPDERSYGAQETTGGRWDKYYGREARKVGTDDGVAEAGQYGWGRPYSVTEP